MKLYQNLKNKFGKSIGAKNPLGFGLYVFGGVGGFYFNPKGDFNGVTKDLWQLKTEGQGIYIPGTPEYDSWYVSYETPSGEILDYKDYAFPHGESYQRLAICFPLGFGFRKSFHSLAGIKLEGGFRYTRTDYLDDVSTTFVGGSIDPYPVEMSTQAEQMSDPLGTHQKGDERGDPARKDWYSFLGVTLSFTVNDNTPGCDYD